MITERRQIIFSPEALRDAVILFRDSYPDRVPHGRVRQVRVHGEPELRVVLEIEPLGDRRPVQHHLSQREVAAGVILFCRQCGVPLPRAAHKYLEVEGGRLSLVLTLQIATASAGAGGRA